MVALKVVKKEGETWRECVARYGKHYGLEYEVLKDFDQAIELSATEQDAAFDALYEWDCLDYDQRD